MLSSTFSTPPSSLYGLVRLVPRIVPPRGRIPDTSRRPGPRTAPSTSPRQPSRIPTQSQPAASALRTTARMTALRPGQSPPPVSMPIVFATEKVLPGSYRRGVIVVLVEKPQLGELLVQHGVLTPEELVLALAEQRQTVRPLGE